MVARATTEMTMATGDEIKLPLTSRDVNADRLAQFRELFPEASTEGKFNLQKLAQLLGEAATDAPERYGLSWSGKSEAIRAIQTTSPGTLLPVTGESVNFDATENLIIEGDNLETLKLLQGGYHGRVKMIYIDPPYNTGGEFIYPDNYKEGLADYLKFSGQVSGEGIRLTTNAETDGRYHSKWLTMMYPRLFLARNLLREDGVIFVSIDDHEVHNLRAVINEIFGEENFMAEFIWKRRKQVDSRTKTGVSIDHEYCLCFRKSDFGVLRGQEIDVTKYKNANNDPLGPWASDNLVGLATKDQRPNLHYDLVNPATKIVYSCPPTGWRYSRETMSKLISEGRILWPEKETGRPRYKRYLSDLSDLFTGQSSILKTAFSADGTNELKELFSDMDVLDFPKPVAYLKLLFSQICKEDDIVLDFFAGSGTTAQAVLELNAQDGGNRKFILVQLPEPTERKDFPTIADITKERVRRVIKKLSAAEAEKSAVASSQLKLGGSAPVRVLDLGFKVFKLASSNFKVWDAAAAPKDGTALAEQLKLMAHNVEDGRPDDALLYELVLKSNLPLTSKITAGKIGEQSYYDVADGALVICLARKLTQATLRGLMARKPKGVICLDIAFAGNDQLKANIVLEMKSHGIEFHTA
ncbi:MAG: site-specific DNA-methyltransferase [Limisphaerales bacterium]|jgi:adenine-specific DNA-methyltransferase